MGRVFGNDPSNFIPPWPLWNDWYINETVWDLTVNELKMRSAAFTASLEFKKSAGKAELEEVSLKIKLLLQSCLNARIT